MPWVMISVMPHQPSSGTRKCSSTDESSTAWPQVRNQCRWGTGSRRSASVQKGTREAQVQRCPTAAGQKPLAEKRGWSTTSAPAHRLAMVE